jgi:hypothetical protein
MSCVCIARIEMCYEAARELYDRPASRAIHVFVHRVRSAGEFEGWCGFELIRRHIDDGVIRIRPRAGGV